MNIVSLEITNFKILRHLRLENIPSLVVIAGPNGSGKTALFDAIRLFKESIASYSVRSPGSAMWHSLLQQVGPVVTVGESQATITASIQVNETERGILGMPDDHPGVLQGHITVSHSGTMTPGQVESVTVTGAQPDHGYLRLLFGERYHRDSNLGVVDHIGPNRQLGSGAVTGINFSVDVLEQELQTLVLNSASKFSTLSQDLVMMRFHDMDEREREVPEPHRYVEGVRQIFRHFLPGTELLDIRLPPGLTGPIEIRVRSESIEHDISQLSSGQREILMTYTHLEKLRPTGSIILFDEPELHLHPALQRRVIAYLRNLLERSSNQVWVITHSEEIVGTTEYDSLFAMSGGAPAITPVASRADRLELLEQLGASVGLQLLSPHILFVEGESDAELLPLFFESLPSGISIVPTGGKAKLMRLTPAAMRLLDDVISEGQFFFVRDRDVEDEPNTLDDLARRYAGHFFTWDRYHIENYLLDEEAIAAVLAEEPGVLKQCMPSQVRTQLRAIADSMKTDVIAKYLEAKLNPMFRERLRLNPREELQECLKKAAAHRLTQMSETLSEDRIGQVYTGVCADIERRWESDWQAMCIGRDVLKTYHAHHVRPHLSYEVFRNHIARKLRDTNRVPEAIVQVFKAVSEGLPPVASQ